MRLLATTALIGMLWSTASAAQCVATGPVSVPEGFNVTSSDLMKETDHTVIYFVIGVVNGTLQSGILGVDRSCIAQVLACVTGRRTDDIVAEFRRTVIAVPSRRSQSASQVIFNIAFGECFRTFNAPASK